VSCIKFLQVDDLALMGQYERCCNQTQSSTKYAVQMGYNRTVRMCVLFYRQKVPNSSMIQELAQFLPDSLQWVPVFINSEPLEFRIYLFSELSSSEKPRVAV
jgi:hypothetical protein